MRLVLLTAFATLWWAAAQADPVTFDGSIGPYDIEAELSRSDDGLVGRYRYAGRDTWLDLTGDAFGQDVIQLSEQVDGEATGTFFLDVVNDQLEGYWVNETDEYTAQLTPPQGALVSLLDPIAEPQVNSSVTGQYFVGSHWVNTMWAPRYEVAFNGGDVNVVAVSPDLIYVRFEFIVGPTYHFAYFEGFARRANERTFIHDQVLEGGDEPCQLAFTFEDATLSIDDNNSGFACQFGMRAHANFDLNKVSDIAEFEDY
ncbi:hypothetical protein SAMN05444287_1167 [Octadecabacter temperatus]|uniref:Uncharacterized protein n=1 Tax=Octadecabacter temperatus TaxID=1458307 RepID=A0A0K0Y504_9RHOB|nr:hypothetical protein [Octadecabacter temperatus]AKS46063.1 hypothetical protein OSB_15110 [Octadecabacter temperatus]SIO06714.1 hypothetical protein SAMN05444287_1167 [Octadecabacter temperatus]